MLNIIADNPLVFLIAALFGLATAWWIWGTVPVAEADTDDEWDDHTEQEVVAEEVVDEPIVDEVIVEETVIAEPEVEPVIDIAREPQGRAAGAASIAAAAATIPSLGSEERAAEVVDGEAALDDMAAAPASGKTPNIAPAIGAPDDLKRIKGVGPKLEALLNSLGVKRFDQIAAWGGMEIAEVDAHLASFRGRIIRDDWRRQAGMLAEGRVTEHRNEFGA